jgi:hypothetical protein
MNDSHKSREQLDKDVHKAIIRAKAKFTTPAILHISQEPCVVGLKAWSLNSAVEVKTMLSISVQLSRSTQLSSQFLVGGI